MILLLLTCTHPRPNQSTYNYSKLFGTVGQSLVVTTLDENKLLAIFFPPWHNVVTAVVGSCLYKLL